MTPHLPCAAVDATWRQGGSRRINCQANQCRSGLRVRIPPSLVKSIYSRVCTEPNRSARHVRRLCSSYIFLDIERIAVVRLQNQSYPLCLISFHLFFNQSEKKQQRRKRSFLQRQANASSLRQSKANDMSISLIGKIAVLKTI